MMKRMMTLMLACVLLTASAVAFAEAVPPVSSFATMTTKTVKLDGDAGQYYEITLSKPVDRLFVLWSDSGLEELAVDEDLKATTISISHPNATMPGESRIYLAVSNYYDVPEFWNASGAAAEPVSLLKELDQTLSNKDSNGKAYTQEELQQQVDRIIALGKLYYQDELNTGAQADLFEIAEAPQFIAVPGQDAEKDGYEIIGDLKIQIFHRYKLSDLFPEFFTVPTNFAAPGDRAYAAVQGKWVVFYNRSGKIVGVSPLEEILKLLQGSNE